MKTVRTIAATAPRIGFTFKQYSVFPNCSRNVPRECSKQVETLRLLEPEAGIEPATYALRVRCSTTEPLGHDLSRYLQVAHRCRP